MKNAFSEEDIKQAFLDLAAKMEKQCGNWQSLPETDRDRILKERIINNCIRRGIQSYYIRISYRTGSGNVCWESFY